MLYRLAAIYYNRLTCYKISSGNYSQGHLSNIFWIGYPGLPKGVPSPTLLTQRVMTIPGAIEFTLTSGAITIANDWVTLIAAALDAA